MFSFILCFLSCMYTVCFKWHERLTAAWCIQPRISKRLHDYSTAKLFIDTVAYAPPNRYFYLSLKKIRNNKCCLLIWMVFGPPCIFAACKILSLLLQYEGDVLLSQIFAQSIVLYTLNEIILEPLAFTQFLFEKKNWVKSKATKKQLLKKSLQKPFFCGFFLVQLNGVWKNVNGPKLFHPVYVNSDFVSILELLSIRKGYTYNKNIAQFCDLYLIRTIQDFSSRPAIISHIKRLYFMLVYVSNGLCASANRLRFYFLFIWIGFNILPAHVHLSSPPLLLIVSLATKQNSSNRLKCYYLDWC